MIYLDSAATAQRPQCVLDAVADFYRCHNANPLRGLYPLSVEATDIYEQARETVRDFIGARSAREIIFTRNTTESLNLVAYSYGLTHVKAGDEVLVSIMEHHSDLLPWQMVCRQTGAELKFIECAPDGSVDLRQIESLITERTKIVAMTQVSNVLGRKYPVQEVAAMAHKKGAVMVVDGAQSTPHMPTDTVPYRYHICCRSLVRISLPSPATRSLAPWGSAGCTAGRSCSRRCRRFSPAAR